MTSPLTEQQLVEIEARKSAATKGPWRGTPATDAMVGEIWSTGDKTRCLARVSWPANAVFDAQAPVEAVDANTAFIAHAPQDVEALLAEVRRLRAALAESESDVALLRALKSFGVDGWDGYDEAIQSASV
ncbi:hypothetical protein MUK60_07605 [Streptomyces sp. LRE541]|uniref:hypothetical protein n=1 Tax=Streptomyces sp. LRE541 TaxID=2931983 RepID=UPI00200E8020|nr:hypothetical protein [Streptomyces sp. LRE541]UPZ27699.1 hypothetical protein MUK60_07605 [Streptomyces sp. LRE541]